MSVKLIYENKEVERVIKETKSIPVAVNVNLNLFQAQYLYSCIRYTGHHYNEDLMNLGDSLESLGFTRISNLMDVGRLHNNFVKMIKENIQKDFGV